MFVDVLNNAAGAVLKQSDYNFLHTIAYYSKALKSSKYNYFITELECLAILDTLGNFFYRLKFIIHIDHASLFLLKNVENLRGRLARCFFKI